MGGTEKRRRTGLNSQNSEHMPRPLPTLSLKVADLFSRPYRFSIPAFQRPYSWSAKEAGQLLEDLAGASGIDDIDEALPDYFLGAMVLLDPAVGSNRPADREATRTVEIVDGQQRAVTLTILLAVLRDAEPDAASPLSRRLDALIREEGGERRFRLALRRSAGELLASHVQTEGSTRLDIVDGADATAGQRAIREVRDHFTREVSRLDDDQRRALASYIVDRCHVVAVLSGGIDHAHRLFAVLNQRGKPLQRSDILKAEVLSQIEPRDSARATEAWERAERILGNDIEGFLAHLRTIHGQTRPQIIAGVRAVVAASGGAMAFIERELEPYAFAHHTLAGLAEGSISLSPAIDRAATYLSRLNGEEWRPAALLAFRIHGEDLPALAMLLTAIDRLAHNLRLLGLGTGRRVQRFAGVITAIRRGTALGEDAHVFAMRREEARKIVHNLKDPHVRSPQLAKLLLLRLGDEIEGTLTRPEISELTVEHVLPQRPPASSEWRKMFPDAKEREHCTESLGNLVLVGQAVNERIRNRDFGGKREALADVPDLPAITREAVEASVWDASCVRSRETRLMRLLSDVLGIELGPNGRATQTAALRGAAESHQ